jgi:hypothetical protein
MISAIQLRWTTGVDTALPFSDESSGRKDFTPLTADRHNDGCVYWVGIGEIVLVAIFNLNLHDDAARHAPNKYTGRLDRKS